MLKMKLKKICSTFLETNSGSKKGRKVFGLEILWIDEKFSSEPSQVIVSRILSTVSGLKWGIYLKKWNKHPKQLEESFGGTAWLQLRVLTYLIKKVFRLNLAKTDALIFRVTTAGLKVSLFCHFLCLSLKVLFLFLIFNLQNIKWCEVKRKKR